ncbi:MAG: hypothetical protein ACK5O2_12140, partial [Microthrixaceae bacterium]
MSAVTAWDETVRELFELAIAAHDHTQTDCAARLRELGATSADQSSVSKWLSGGIRTPSSRIRAAIQRYIDEADLGERDKPRTADA